MTAADWQDQLTERWFQWLAVALAAAAVLWVVARLARRRAPAIEVRPLDRDVPRCTCGGYASAARPGLSWTRSGIGAWLRDLHGAPPRYLRSVDGMRPTEVCPAHAAVMDSALNEWIHGVRRRYAALNAQVAAEAAAIDEVLDKAVKDSLTKAQELTGKKVQLTAVRALPSAGRAEGES